MRSKYYKVVGGKMDININKEKENLLIMRKEVEGEAIHSSKPTPTKEEIITYLSTKYHVNSNQIDLIYVISKKGQSTAKFVANIYNKPIKRKEEDKGGEENGQA